MARTRRHMSGSERQAWAKHFDKEKEAGRTKRAGGMEFAKDKYGNQFQRNGNACPGKGFDAQAATNSSGQAPHYDRPPYLPGKCGKPLPKPKRWF